MFYARVHLEATISSHNWDSLGFIVQGKLLASSGPNDFTASYLDGMLSLFSKIGNDENKRLDYAKNVLSNVQEHFTRAQERLNNAQHEIDRARKAFDSAVSKLEDAKKVLFEAKEPLNTALEKLKNAQRRVDVLCRLNKCVGPCVPKLRFRWCKSGWFHYPCLQHTNCLVRLPDIKCETANLACKILRGLAYAVLEAAQSFVRGPCLPWMPQHWQLQSHKN